MLVVFLWAALFTLGNSWWHWLYLCDWTEPNLLSWIIYRGNSWAIALELLSKEQKGGNMNSLFSSWGIRRLSAIRWECYSRPRGNSRNAVCVSQKHSLDHSVSAPHLKMFWVDGDINLSDQKEGATLHMLLWRNISVSGIFNGYGILFYYCHQLQSYQYVSYPSRNYRALNLL